MKIALLFIFILTTTIGCATNQNSTVDKNAQNIGNVPDILSGVWTLKVENLQHEVITILIIHFTENEADSCLGGNWKQIVVDSHNTKNDQFFPANEPLSYELENNKLVIGHNEICDDYLHLSGELLNSNANGEYVAFGLGGGKQIGYFTLIRDVSNGT